MTLLTSWVKETNEDSLGELCGAQTPKPDQNTFKIRFFQIWPKEECCTGTALSFENMDKNVYHKRQQYQPKGPSAGKVPELNYSSHGIKCDFVTIAHPYQRNISKASETTCI